MSTDVVKKEQTELQKKELTASERFTGMVMKEFEGNVGELNLNDYQRQLIRNYFIGIDNALKNSEANRQSSIKKKDDPTVTWNNVNMNKLATDVVQNAKLGLDMSIANHLHVVPYKNSKTGKYDLNLMAGYEGLKYIATQFSLYKIVDIKVELVRENDTFQPVYKNNIEGYEFKITNPFNRGNVIGGFGYIRYENEIHNKLVVMTVDELLKRKPSTASAEFWGGTKYNYTTKENEKVEGWTDEMLYKTMVRATCKKVTVDPKKVNQSYVYVIDSNDSFYIENQEDRVEQEIEKNANKEIIDITDSTEKLPASALSAENTVESTIENNKSEGPGF